MRRAQQQQAERRQRPHQPADPHDKESRTAFAKTSIPSAKAIDCSGMVTELD